MPWDFESAFTVHSQFSLVYVRLYPIPNMQVGDRLILGQTPGRNADLTRGTAPAQLHGYGNESMDAPMMENLEIDQNVVDMMTPSQRNAMRHLLAGEDVFLTGKAGTGKSFVMNLFLAECKNRGLQTVAMAPTGTAALNLIDGSTIHRTLRIKNGVLDPCDARQSQLRSQVLAEADVVVIDEISMCRLDLFDRVMAKVRHARKKKGAKQVVVVGDFFQLPPIAIGEEGKLLKELYPAAKTFFAFNGAMWAEMGFVPCLLNEVVRQPDPELARNLNLAREGDHSCIPYFNKRAVRRVEDVPSDVLWLTSTNKFADEINSSRVEEIVKGGEAPRTFRSEEEGEVKQSDKAAPDELRIVKGARVMLAANMKDLNLGNGSMGTVTGIVPDGALVLFDGRRKEVLIEPKTWDIKKTVVSSEPDEEGRMVRRLSAETVGRYTQLPLRLGFAITIHKAQGKTFDACAVDTRTFEAGMLYVALSRCTSYENMYLWPPISAARLYSNRDVEALYDRLEDASALAAAPSAGSWASSPTLLDYQRQDAVDGLFGPENALGASDEAYHAQPQAADSAIVPARAPRAASPAPAVAGRDDAQGDEMVQICVPARIADRVRGYADALLEQMAIDEGLI